MSDRGMKKWIPYKSLIEQDMEMSKWRSNREKIAKPTLCEDKMNEINDYLTSYSGQDCEVVYFYNGYIVHIQGTIKKIDINCQSLEIEDTKIPLIDLLDIYSI